MYKTRIRGIPRNRSVYATATIRKGKNTGPGICRTTAMTRARIRIKTSEITKISTFKRKAPTTDGVPCVPTIDCQRWKGLKKRSATISLPGASTAMRAITAKKRIVLALETSTALPPSIFEPRPGLDSCGSNLSPGPVPLVVILFLEGRDAQVLLQVFLLESAQRPVLLHLAEDLVYAPNQRVSLLEEHPELLVPGVLAGDYRVVDLDVAQVNRRQDRKSVV